MTQFSKKKIISQKGATDLTSTNARITVLENNEYKITYYEIISGASGSLTLPTGATINAGEFGLSGNAVLSKIDGSNKPTFESPKTSGDTVVTASLNEITGAWVASGVYTDPSVALIYSIKIKAINYSNLTYSKIIETVDDNGDFLSKNNNLSDVSNPLTARENLKHWNFFITGGNVTTTSNVASNITGFVTPTLTINKRYRMSGTIHTGCNNTGGVRLQVTLPTGCAISGFMVGSNVPNASQTAIYDISAGSTFVTSAFNQWNSQLGHVNFMIDVQMDTTAGTIQFGFASNINTQTSTIYQLGTFGILEQLD